MWAVLMLLIRISCQTLSSEASAMRLGSRECQARGLAVERQRSSVCRCWSLWEDDCAASLHLHAGYVSLQQGVLPRRTTRAGSVPACDIMLLTLPACQTRYQKHRVVTLSPPIEAPRGRGSTEGQTA